MLEHSFLVISPIQEKGEGTKEKRQKRLLLLVKPGGGWGARGG